MFGIQKNVQSSTISFMNFSKIGDFITYGLSKYTICFFIQYKIDRSLVLTNKKQ